MWFSCVASNLVFLCPLINVNELTHVFVCTSPTHIAFCFRHDQTQSLKDSFYQNACAGWSRRNVEQGIQGTDLWCIPLPSPSNAGDYRDLSDMHYVHDVSLQENLWHVKVDIYRLLVLVQKVGMTNHLDAVTFINDDLHAPVMFWHVIWLVHGCTIK